MAFDATVKVWVAEFPRPDFHEYLPEGQPVTIETTGEQERTTVGDISVETLDLDESILIVSVDNFSRGEVHIATEDLPKRQDGFLKRLVRLILRAISLGRLGR